MALSSLAAVRPNALNWLGLSASLIVLDQASKWYAVSHLGFEQPVQFMAGFWNWTLTHNTGSAFSFLAGPGAWKQVFFIVLALVISTALVIGLRSTARRDWRTAVPFALVIAGALGNLIDRLRLGYVVDFIQWYWHSYYWPVFNIADSCIVIAVVMMALFSLGRKETAR